MGTLENTFRVAIFDEFLDAFAKIPRAQQKKVRKFMRQFRSDPTNPSINYEQISSFRDPNMRTVRIAPSVSSRRTQAPKGEYLRSIMGRQPRRSDGLGEE